MPYYGGDPGFLSFLGKIGKGVVGLLPGGGTAVKAIESVGALARRVKPVGAGMAGALARIPRGGKIAIAGGAAAAGVAALTMGGAPGVPPRGMKFSARLGKMVKIRRMRVTNPRALRRAVRRAYGFARLARKVLAFTSPRPPRGRMYFRRGMRRSRARVRA